MKYRVTYNYVETRYDSFEDEEYYVPRFKCMRYFNNFADKEQFLQDFDMASEVGDYIVSEDQISDIKSGIYYGLAAVLYAVDAVTNGVFHKHISHGFYNLMEKTLINLVRNPMCEKFDSRIRLL